MFRDVADRTHHDERADGDHVIIFFPRLELFFQRGGHKALMPVRSVIRHDVEIRARFFEFVHQDHQIRVAEADDDIHLRAHIVQRLCLRIRDGDA
ncbi:hypothetical protein SDC9_120838 [bioreactor metagenome]|uniref:Uncharacterized protein n=1 Tax=bioreactor metagenome TaxID=1076179 RepID=A0A645CAA0_9ZZZZ